MTIAQLKAYWGVTDREHAECMANARILARADAINDIERACAVMTENELAADRADEVMENI